MSTPALSPCDLNLALATAARPCRHPTATLAATILGSGLAFVDGSVMNVALPALDRDFHPGPDGLTWLINGYLLTLTALILLGGAAGDHYGRRRLFLAGIGLFLAASLVCAAAPTLPIFLAGRVAQGIGAAMLMPNSLALLGAGFDGEAKGQAIGTWAGVGALAGAIGPLIGGWLVDAVGWRTIFLLNLPIGLAAAGIAWRFVPESHDSRAGGRLDLPGALLGAVALALCTWALTAAAKPGADQTLLIGAGVVGCVLLAAFGWLELQRGENALMPLFLMRNATFLGVTLLTLLLYAALGGLIVLLPFVLITTEGYSAVQAGAAMLPVPILIGVGSRLMGRIATRIGSRLPMGLGALIVAVGLVLYLLVGRVSMDDTSYWREVLPATLVVALGMAVCVAPLTTTVMSSVDPDHVGAASGFNSAVARLGGLIATALLGFVFAEQGSPVELLVSMHVAALVGAGLAALAGASAFLLVRDLPAKGTAHG
jgi:EmrB/QacA subfamily drug resistance transporter